MGYKLVLVSDHPESTCPDGWIETWDWILVAETRGQIEQLLSKTFLDILLKNANREWERS